ncbi:putative aconitate hydratase [Rhizoclosmatium globosum]|uniref:Aconitate hydratase, mitochondrial n=1 Tax=Rhizoclosmatium globosum TaxID=329046 RepID=A0A1Y2CK63_9FUNG|nr:putative aconitate hydratase [Rhizoclosmatium globosum]|eukprot:ORY47392.1 putative aconitate hydratase [Rhizoclosmatium globosum]
MVHRPAQILARVSETLKSVRSSGGVTHKLTLAEKILYGHLDLAGKTTADLAQPITRGETYLKLNPDRVAMQDASAQMAILQFMLCGRKTTAVPTSIHCDHLIQAHNGAEQDLTASKIKEKEIFSFLESSAKKYGIAFWGPGSGIIHQIVLENYAAPGTLMLGTDSHTPNAGGLGMLAIGVGGADAVDGMANIPWELKAPKVLGVRLTGKLSGWATPKDVILALAGKLTVRGGTNYIIEYFGPGTESLGCTGMATICNMGAEVGATTSVFPYNAGMASYLRSTGRSETADASDKYLAEGLLKADAGCEYDKVIEIDLSTVEPHINGPFTPDAATPISQFKDLIKKNGWNDVVSAGLIGSCTNSSYEDMSRVSSIARQAKAHGIKTTAEFLVTPGSEQVRATIARDGITEDLEQIGGKVLANACGPCIGQWNRTDPVKNEQNSILTSFNRNFKARNDGSNKTMNFLASPEIVTSMALSGRLSFNPITDTLNDKDGKPFKLAPPTGNSLPSKGFDAGRLEFKPSATPQPDETVQITIDPASQRLQVLEPFDAWNGRDMENLKVLVKVQGKCTTDHISAAGVWLKYKGHLDNLANNTLIGAVNAYNGKINSVTNELTGKEDTIPNVARAYKASNTPWTVIGDWNYGEGSAREHAALQPRFLGCGLIISRSFARIHETNLKKQGVIPITFANPDDYDLITEGCSISTQGLSELAPGSKVSLKVTSKDGKVDVISMNHTLSEDQIAWIKAGSALNLIRDQMSQ